MYFCGQLNRVGINKISYLMCNFPITHHVRRSLGGLFGRSLNFLKD